MTTPVAPTADTPPAQSTAAGSSTADAAAFNQVMNSAAMGVGTIVYGPLISSISGNPYYEAYEK